MAWEIPLYDQVTYNKAGRTLLNGSSLADMDYDFALKVINNWRLSHYRPLNTFRRRLTRLATEVDGNSLVAQRIKRLSSICHKLERYPSMRLVQIQDIGGCRAIVSTVDHLYKLVNIIASRDKERSSRGVKHKLVFEKDYIKDPKTSGYRGVHLVFKYQSDKGASSYDGMKTEMQFRTFIQHAWATAVETVGIFMGQALKSSIGQKEWLRFFTLAASAMASFEGCLPVPDINLTPDEIRVELRKHYSELDVSNILKTFGAVIEFMGKKMRDAEYFLLELNADEKRITVMQYKKWQIEKAATDYLEVEKRIKNINADAVLVSADSVSALKKAYPNYFLDTKTFLGLLEKIMA